MKGSLYTLLKRGEIKGGGGKTSLMKPHCPSFFVKRGIIGKLLVRHFKRRHKRWCLKVRGACTPYLKVVGSYHLLARVVYVQ